MPRMALSEKARSRSWRIENLYVMPIIAVAAAVAGYTLLDWTPPVDPQSIHAKAMPATVTPAGVYCIRWEAKRNRVCNRQTSHTFVDSTGFIHRPDLAPGSLKPETGSDFWTRCYYAPAGASWGRAEHRVKINFYCNPLHNWWPITVEPEGVPVEVVKPLE